MIYSDSLADEPSAVEARRSAPDQTGLGPIQPAVKWVPFLLMGIKNDGVTLDHKSSCSVEVKERAEVYLFFPSGPS